jgi:hypothetical protein
MELQNLTYSQAASYDQILAFHHHIQAGRKRTRKNNSNTKLEVAVHSMKYLQNIEFSDQTATRDNNVNYIKRKANSIEAG